MWIFPSPNIGGVEIASWIEFLDQLWANRTLCYVEVKCFWRSLGKASWIEFLDQLWA